MYLLGIAVALALGVIMRKTVLPVTKHAPTIMEMPPYRMPTGRSIWFHTWTRIRAFLREAGSIIFATMIAASKKWRGVRMDPFINREIDKLWAEVFGKTREEMWAA